MEFSADPRDQFNAALIPAMRDRLAALHASFRSSEKLQRRLQYRRSALLIGSAVV
jgi:hypothetical protein